MNCDWLISFDDRLGMYPEIQNLKTQEFHGSVTINFCSGVPQNYDIKLHRRVETEQPLQKGA